MEEYKISTPYDDVFRTLMSDCTSLLIPVVNEVFHEHYTGDETIRFIPNEHFIQQPGANTKEKITDSCFEIQNNIHKKKYHMECQSTADNHMVIRMFEYDSQIALDDGEVTGNNLVVTFPHSGVLYLRHTRNTPDVMNVQIRTPGGSLTYEIPVMKIQTYTIDEIFDKGLLFLIPFHIFCYEKKFDEYETNEQKLRQLQQEYQYIRNRLEALSLSDKISEYEKCTLIDMSKKVLDNIAAKYANVRKEVTSVMGGKVLDYEAKDILQSGIRQGKVEGKQGTLLELVHDGLLSVDEAARRLKMSKEEVEKLSANYTPDQENQ